MLNEIIKYCQIGAYLAASIGIIFTVFTYRNNTRIKRGEWLKDLFDKFYRESNFITVRMVIEYNRMNTFLDIDTEGIPTNEENEETLVNYLNFFEFISILIKRGHLRNDEVKDLFGYYLQTLNSQRFIKNYISEFGFENLETLLSRYE